MATERGEGSTGLLRTRATVLLPLATAVLSVATGVLNIGAPGFEGPLAAVIPPSVQQTAGFTGALTGFLLLASAFGLRRRLRAAWYSTVVLLPLAALQGLLQVSQLSFPLVVLSLLSLPTLLVHRRLFDRALDLTPTQLAALAAVLAAQVYGTVGAYALRGEFGNVSTLTDAFYFTLVTASTVGYGDVTPVPTSQIGKLFSMSVVLIGTASFAVALGTLVGPIIEKRLSQALGQMNDSDLTLLDDHVIVVGHSDLTEPILERLTTRGAAVVITRDAEMAARLRERGYQVVTADPSDEEPLERVGIERASALVAATDDDALDALAILTARELNPEVRIVAAATERENVKKLQRAGADTVLAPAVIGGQRLADSALEPAAGAGGPAEAVED
jgi:voltage-gated potassium channel